MNLDKFCKIIGELGYGPIIAHSRFALDIAPLVVPADESQLDELIAAIVLHYPTFAPEPLQALDERTARARGKRSAWYYSQPLFWRNLYEYAHSKGYVDFIYGNASNITWLKAATGIDLWCTALSREECEVRARAAMDARWGV